MNCKGEVYVVALVSSLSQGLGGRVAVLAVVGREQIDGGSQLLEDLRLAVRRLRSSRSFGETGEVSLPWGGGQAAGETVGEGHVEDVEREVGGYDIRVDV